MIYAENFFQYFKVLKKILSGWIENISAEYLKNFQSFEF